MSRWSLILLSALLSALLPVAGGETRALVVGIDKYPVFGELSSARHDAKAVAAVLAGKAGLKPGNVTLMTDDAAVADLQPTAANLQRQIRRLAAAAAPGDPLLFVFFGHGTEGFQGNDGYLVPMDGLTAGGLALSTIKDIVKASSASGVLAILDLTHNGSSAVGVFKTAPTLATPESLILLACGPGQRSPVDDTGERTFFGAAVARGFQDVFLDPATTGSAGEVYAAILRQFKPPMAGGAGSLPLLLGDPRGKLRILFAGRDSAAAGPAGQAPWFEKPLYGHAWTLAGLEMAFAPVKPGAFAMGANAGEKDEIPVHEVTFSYDFWAGRTEVTQAQYHQVMDANPASQKGDRLPVVDVSWNDAAAFCVRLTERQQAAGTLPKGYVYRLPTEAEWEYVCRAGATGAFCFGDNLAELVNYGNFAGSAPVVSGQVTAGPVADTFPQLAPVASFKPNEWGVYDMHGNAWEWCMDWYDTYPARALTDDSGPAHGFVRVIRGGSWRHVAASCRAAVRGNRTPENTSDFVGFRVFLAPAIGTPPRQVPAVP